MTNKSDNEKMVDSDCLEAFDHLYAYLNGELDNEESVSKIEHHLKHCKSCFSRAQMERELNYRLKKSGEKRTPDSLQKRLRKLINDF